MKSAGKNLTCGKGLCWSQRTGSQAPSRTRPQPQRQIPHGHTATPSSRGSQGRVGAPTLHVWGWLTSERVCTRPSADRPGSLQGACAPRPGRHPGCGCSYTCPAQASSAGNPPAAPGMCQLGLRTMPSWVERAAALTQTHLGQVPNSFSGS